MTRASAGAARAMGLPFSHTARSCHEPTSQPADPPNFGHASAVSVPHAREEQMSVPGETKPAYRLGDRDGFLSADGSVWCRHGHKLPPLTSAKRPRAFKVERGKCGCEVRLPGRVSCIPLGRVAQACQAA